MYADLAYFLLLPLSILTQTSWLWLASGHQNLSWHHVSDVCTHMHSPATSKCTKWFSHMVTLLWPTSLWPRLMRVDRQPVACSEVWTAQVWNCPRRLWTQCWMGWAKFVISCHRWQTLPPIMSNDPAIPWIFILVYVQFSCTVWCISSLMSCIWFSIKRL